MVACPLFWVGVLVSDQWAVLLMSWSLNICSTILTGLRQMFICKVNSVYYLWYNFGFELTEQVLTIDAKRSDLLYLPASLESTVILCFVQYFLCVSNHVSTFDQACVCSAPPQYSVCVGQCVLLWPVFVLMGGPSCIFSFHLIWITRYIACWPEPFTSYSPKVIACHSVTSGIGRLLLRVTPGLVISVCFYPQHCWRYCLPLSKTDGVVCQDFIRRSNLSKGVKDRNV